LVFFGTIALPAVTNGTVNDLISSYQLATPAALGANEDTIYSAAIYDLFADGPDHHAPTS
jgi:hypothetical protein